MCQQINHMKKILQFIFSFFKRNKPEQNFYFVLKTTRPVVGTEIYINDSIPPGTTTDINSAAKFDSTAAAMQYKIDNPQINAAFFPSVILKVTY